MGKRRLEISNRYSRDLKRLIRRNQDLSRLKKLHTKLEENALGKAERDHILKGGFQGYRCCHVSGDWIVIYRFIRTMFK